MKTKKVHDRIKQLSGNFNRMFFIQAFQNIRTINVVVTLFYLSRGITLSQVFFLSIIWSAVNLFFEVPSSFLADHWGRKKTLVLGTALYVVSCIWLVFAHNFWVLSASLFFYALSNACYTGTDDALIYDTSRELKNEHESLRRFGHYYSAERIFKIITPLVGALVAKDLTSNQFFILLIIDAIASVIAFIISLFIVEPKRHYIEVEKVESGIILDAFKTIKSNPYLVKAICNRSFGFIGFFIFWRYHQELFVSVGTPIIVLGIGWSIFHFIMFISIYHIHKLWPKKNIATKINTLNFLMILFISLFVIGWYFKIHYYWLVLIYFVGNFFENVRWPIFTNLFNKYSNSFNRATTLSLSNLTKSVLDIPLLFLGGILVSYDHIYPIYLIMIFVTLSSIVFYLPQKLKLENKF